MRPSSITPGQTRVTIRFWAQELSSPDQFGLQLRLFEDCVETTATISSYGKYGCVVICDENQDLKIPASWQAIVGWNDVLGEIK